MAEQVLMPLLLSLKVASCATAAVVVCGIALAYLLARRDFPGREWLDVLFTLPLVLPPTVVGYFLVLFLGRNGVIGRWLYELTGLTVMFTWQAAAIASAVVSLPLMVKAARAAIESVDRRLVQASYTLGKGEIETLWRIVLPLARRGIIAGAILSFARALGEFGATLMLAGNIPGVTATMPLAIYTETATGEWQAASVMVAIFTLVSALALFAVSRLGRVPA